MRAQKAQKFIMAAILVALMVMACYYNITLDLILIAGLFLSGYLLGSIIRVNGIWFEKLVVRMAAGVGMIGIIFYFLLLFGLGSKSTYLSVLLLSCLTGIMTFSKWREDLEEHCRGIIGGIKKYGLFLIILLAGFGCYLAYGSMAIETYDALAKHLPITVYAASTGGWYTNVTESLVYGEPMVLQYTYSAMFLTLGANKALILFNVILFFLLFGVLYYLLHSIYRNTSIWILAVIYFTTPLFISSATTFWLEILPMFFFFTAIAGIGSFDKEKIWNNIELISFLCGCSLFVKLTHIFTMAVLGGIMAVICAVYAIKEKQIKAGILKMVCSGLLLILPFIVSLINIWYKIGNPLFPMYNAVFKSPYYPLQNFEDPFTNKLSFSLRSLLDIVFHSVKNVEMNSGALGVYLLFVFLLPVSLLLIKKGNRVKVFIWYAIVLVCYMLNTLMTYNLRYYLTVWVFMAGMITICFSAFIDKACISWLKTGLVCLCMCMLLLPNAWYCWKYLQIPLKLAKDERLVKNFYCELLNEMPEGKRVLAITDRNQLKGDYKGYYTSTTWHNTFNLINLNNGVYSLEDYISSFDYVLIDKFNPDKITLLDEDILSTVQPLLGEKCGDSYATILYKVNPIKENIVDQKFDTPQDSSVEAPVIEVFESGKTNYYITEDIENNNDETVTMRYQINWMTEDGEILDVHISTYEAAPGRETYVSEKIPGNLEADYGIVYVCPSDEHTVKVHSYSLEGFTDVISYETQQLQQRSLLTSN